MAKAKRKSSHGGARPGAGAKPKNPPGCRPRAIRLTDAEYSRVCEFVAKIRTEGATKTPEKQAS